MCAEQCFSTNACMMFRFTEEKRCSVIVPGPYAITDASDLFTID